MKRIGQRRRLATIASLAGAALTVSPTTALAGRHADGHRGRHARAAHSHAHTAHTLTGTETAHLRLVRQHEEHLYEQGSASGPLPGRMSASLTVGATFTGEFQIHTRAGTITGHGTASPRGTGRYQSFRGTMIVSGGSGRYAHVHGRTQLSGSFDRRTFDVTIHTKGRLSY